jgi:pimeloyl-ACP methyl ester carboxylesterase
VPLVEVNAVRLEVQDAGHGAPIVLVHGSWDDRHVWALVEDDLAKSFRVVSYDRRGHTDSEDSPEPGTRRDDEDDLAALIEARGLAPANLVGSSFGGSITLGLAARRPELVRSVCAHEPPLLALAADDPVVTEIIQGLGPVVSLIDGGDLEAGARLFVEMAIGPGAWDDMSPEEQGTMLRNARTFPDELRDRDGFTIDLDALAEFPSSVLLTGGDESPPFFGRILTRLVEAMKTARVRTLPGAGHVPHVTHPHVWVAVVREFVNGVK